MLRRLLRHSLGVRLLRDRLLRESRLILVDNSWPLLAKVPLPLCRVKTAAVHPPYLDSSCSCFIVIYPTRVWEVSVQSVEQWAAGARQARSWSKTKPFNCSQVYVAWGR